MRKFARILALALVAVTTALAAVNIPDEFRNTETGLQRSVAVAVTLYVVFGLLTTVGMLRRQRWVPAVATAWAVAVTYAAGIASFAFSDPGFRESGTAVGVVAATVSCSLIGWLVVWAAREWARGKAPAEPVG